MAINPETTTDFDSSRLALWTAAFERGTRLHQTLMSAAGDQLQNWMKSLQEFLTEHRNKSGGMSRIECKNDELKSIDIFGELPYITHAGSDPWLVAARPYAMRFGPGSFPMPGFGCLMMACSSDFDVWVVVMPTQAVLERGISLNDLPTFLDSPSGIEALRTLGSAIPLRERTLLWVPFGSLCLLIAIPKHDMTKDKEEKKKQKDKEKDIGPAFLMVFTPFSGPLARTMSQSTWSATKALNLAHLTRVEGRVACASRVSLMNSFVEGAQAAISGTT